MNEQLLKDIQRFIFSGQEPFKIAENITKYISEKYTPIQEVKGVDWIDEWLNIFPKGVKTGGKLVRSDAKICKSKMESFIKNYPQFNDKSLILNVTERYVKEFEQNDYMYMKAASYFIDKKGEGSELAARCEEGFIEVEESSENNSFFI